MPQSNPQQICLVHADASPWQRPAARYHAFEHLAIDRAHDFRRAYNPAWRPGHDLIGLCEIPAGALYDEGAGRSEPGIRCNRLWIIALDASECQCFSREIQSSNIGILIDIAQDIRKLKGATKMVSQSSPITVIHAKNTNAQASNRAGDPIAIKIKLIEGGSLDVRARIHLHAFDNGQEIVLAQTEARNRLGKIFKSGRNTS